MKPNFLRCTTIHAVLLLLLMGSFSCKLESEKIINPFPPAVHLDSIKNKPQLYDSIITYQDADHFEMVKQYIEKTGKYKTISASAIAGDTSMMIDYYSIQRGNWNITKDHHTRIYFSQEDYSYGNIFLLQDAVYVEPYYTGPEENIDTLHEIILPITSLYNQVLEDALKYQDY